MNTPVKADTYQYSLHCAYAFYVHGEKLACQELQCMQHALGFLRAHSKRITPLFVYSENKFVTPVLANAADAFVALPVLLADAGITMFVELEPVILQH